LCHFSPAEFPVAFPIFPKYSISFSFQTQSKPFVFSEITGYSQNLILFNFLLPPNPPNERRTSPPHNRRINFTQTDPVPEEKSIRESFPPPPTMTFEGRQADKFQRQNLFHHEGKRSFEPQIPQITQKIKQKTV
jgi:hypothetical protein